ncbi:hypothetical protein C4D60_Mb09t19080 [Musa balbisiana]|uniref:C2H2-type domain-containing protein n=1 Tax=Musa balbisiana TaxID=52838 RepID=A0A4S8IJY6_MUSBA|nr:hypothetical protein C4D60_Mb09t19080 [Musa balbisiana]
MERCGIVTTDNCSSNSSSKGKEPWMSYTHTATGGPLPGSFLAGFSWPPRSYTCSFCSREFKTAQALGGHMNVHRRDKARLRQSPPRGPLPFDLNPNPSPGGEPVPFSSAPNIPNLNMPPPSSSSGDKIFLEPNTLPSMTSPLTHFSFSRGDDLNKMETVKALFGTEEVKDLMEKDTGNELQQGREVVRLELEIGICGDCKDELDLELRLGYT